MREKLVLDIKNARLMGIDLKHSRQKEDKKINFAGAHVASEEVSFLWFRWTYDRNDLERKVHYPLLRL